MSKHVMLVRGYEVTLYAYWHLGCPFYYVTVAWDGTMRHAETFQGVDSSDNISSVNNYLEGEPEEMAEGAETIAGWLFRKLPLTATERELEALRYVMNTAMLHHHDPEAPLAPEHLDVTNLLVRL